MRNGPQALASEANIRARPLAKLCQVIIHVQQKEEVISLPEPNLSRVTLFVTKIIDEVNPKTFVRNRREINVRRIPVSVLGS